MAVRGQVVAMGPGAAKGRLEAAEGRLKELVTEVHAAAGEVLAAAAAVGAAERKEVVPSNEGPMLLTVEQVAEQLGISVSKAWQMVSAGEIPSVNVGRTLRIRPCELAEYVARL